MTDVSDKHTYFSNLDALRFIAFLGVFFSHTVQWHPTGKLADFLFSVLTLNYFGVPFFFTLSSFLITFNLLGERLKYGKIDLFKFYTNRALRIWPVYFLMLLFYFFMLPALAGFLNTGAPTLAPLAPFLFFYANFYIIAHGNNFSLVLLILWSISIEEQFYFFWGIVFKYINTKLVVYLLLLLMIFSILFSYYYQFVLGKPGLTIHTFFVLQNFIPGALLAWIFLTRKKLYFKISNIPPGYLLMAYALLPIAYADVFSVDIIWLNVIKSICYTIIIYDQALNHRRFFNLGAFSFINYLGKISYGLYIYHALVISLLQKSFHFFGAGNESSLSKNLLQATTAFVITFVIAHLSYRYLELKFLAMKLRKRVAVK